MVEIDFLLQLSNHRFIAIEVKRTPADLTPQQNHLLDSLQLPIIERWVVCSIRAPDFQKAKVVCVDEIFDRLGRYY